MPHKIIFNVAAREPVFPECVKVLPDKSYEDTVTKGKEYFGESQISVSFINLCGKSFQVPAMELFSNRENGGTFAAKLDAFSIGAGQTLSVPLKYYGTTQSADVQKNYIVSINGSTAPFLLHIIQPKVQHAPVISDVEIILENRQNYTFRLSDFEGKFTDVDGDAMDSIILAGDLSSFRLNGQPMSSPATISAYQISIGALVYLAKDTDDEVSVAENLKAKDATGLISQ